MVELYQLLTIEERKKLTEGVLPELGNRVSIAMFSGRIEIRTEEDRVVLQIKGGEVSTVAGEGQNVHKTSHRVLAQHLTSYLPPREALKRGLARANPPIAKIVDLLFKNKVLSYMWKADRF